MAKPPTFNDLKRLKSQSSLKRFKIINASVARTQPLTLNPFISRNTISVNNVDNLAAQGKAFAVTKAYTGGTTNNTYQVSGQNILYYPGTLNIDRTSPGPNLNLWSVNGQPIQLSDNFSYDIPSTDISVKQDFWNDKTITQSSQTLEVSTVVFDDLQYTGISAYNFDPSKTMYLSTNEFTTNQMATLIFSFDRSDEHVNNLFDNNTVVYHPLSVYKDGVYLAPGSYDVPFKGDRNVLSKPVKYSVAGRYYLNVNGNGITVLIDDPDNRYEGNGFPISATPVEISEYYDRPSAVPPQYRDVVSNFGAFVFRSILSAGNYEFKFQVSDRNNSNNVKESTINLNVDNVTFETKREQSLKTIMDIVTSNPAPAGTYSHLQVLSSTSYLSGGWNSNFWGFDNRDMLNFSGICWDSNAAQDIGEPCPQNRSNIRATLITPRHAIASAHYYIFNSGPRPNGGSWTQAWQPGDHMYFYDHTTGAPVSAIVENEYRLTDYYAGPNCRNLSGSYFSTFITPEYIEEMYPGVLSGQTYTEFLSNAGARFIGDVQLIYLDRDVTAGNDIKVYPLANDDNRLTITDLNYPLITTGGANRGGGRRNAGIAATKDEKNSFLHQKKVNIPHDITREPREGSFQGYEPSNQFYFNYSTLSALSDELPENYTFGGARDGDSSSPTFMLIDNQLALYTHNAGAHPKVPPYPPDSRASGPSYTTKDVQERLQGFINQIGNTEGYQLSTINAL